MEQRKIIVICGPTASGKSKLALKLGEKFKAEIVSADSMQLYRHLDIGTAKPTKAERLRVAHHMIDHIEPDEPYSAAQYRVEASDAIEQIGHRLNNIIVCGGTGLYIRVLTRGIFEGPERDPKYRKALEEECYERGLEFLHARLEEVDPVSAKKIHPNTKVRIIRALEVFHASGIPISEFHAEHAFAESPYNPLLLYIDRPREELYTRINKRTEQMLKDGLLDETRTLIGELGYNQELKPLGALGYKEMLGVINNEYSMEEATELLKKNTRNYAKRQITWFNNMEGLVKVSPNNTNEIITLIRGHLK
jgi:tRNA dimethylallyltransferase